MKKVLSLVALAMISTIMFAVNDGVKADHYSCFRARSISRFPPGGPGRRSTINPAACNIRLTTPLAQ